MISSPCCRSPPKRTTKKNKADTAALLHSKAALQFHHPSALQASSSQIIHLHLSYEHPKSTKAKVLSS